MNSGQADQDHPAPQVLKEPVCHAYLDTLHAAPLTVIITVSTFVRAAENTGVKKAKRMRMSS